MDLYQKRVVTSLNGSQAFDTKNFQQKNDEAVKLSIRAFGSFASLVAAQNVSRD